MRTLCYFHQGPAGEEKKHMGGSGLQKLSPFDAISVITEICESTRFARRENEAATCASRQEQEKNPRYNQINKESTPRRSLNLGRAAQNNNALALM